MTYSYTLFKTYTFPYQAELDLSKLKNEGISAFVNDINMGSFSFLGAATGGVKLYVAEKDLERALKVLPNKSKPEDPAQSK